MVGENDYGVPHRQDVPRPDNESEPPAEVMLNLPNREGFAVTVRLGWQRHVWVELADLRLRTVGIWVDAGDVRRR